MAHKTSRDFSKLIGKSYSDMNCWEAARSFYKTCFNLDLKHYCEEAPEDREDIKDLIYTNMGDFSDVKGEMKFGDLLLFRVRGVESHIGVFVSPGRFFHSSKSTGSCVDRLDRWKNVLVGAYRLKGGV